MKSTEHVSVHVDLGQRSYPVLIGRSLLGRQELLQPYIPGHQVMIVSNETIAALYLDAVRRALDGKRIDVHLMPDGEQHKNFTELVKIYDSLLEHRHERGTTLIALGGGVVGDITGFAAATYQRGVNFVQLPTTLLAQVDSSVGGKTAVNHALGKNMIGAFYQPRCVIADLDSLESLPEREFAAGLAEVVKYGLIADRGFYDWLHVNRKAIMHRETAVLIKAVKRSCEIKAEVVAQDETETGRRAILNFGHTFGHAIETSTRYSKFLHGEAVAVGMVMAMRLSISLGAVADKELQRLTELLVYFGLPVVPPAGMDPADFLELMALDKKVKAGRIRLVLLEKLGTARVFEGCDLELIRRSLEEARDELSEGPGLQ